MYEARKAAKVVFAVIFILSGTLTASAQKRDDRNKGQKDQDVHNRDTRPQQRVTPQRQPNVNRTPVNTAPVNRTVPNRTTVNRTQVNINRTPGRVQTVRTTNRPGYRPTGWAPTRRAYTRPPVVYKGRRYYTYHKYYPHYYTAFFYGPRWHPIGFFLSALEGTAIIIDLENRHYRYDAGVFYAPYNNGYQVVPAPPGAYVPSIPEGYQQTEVGGQTYYYFGGAFFVMNRDQYEVVQAPAGAVVYNLPQGASTVQIDNYNYVEYNGTYYQPIQINGRDAYEVVELEDDTQQ